MSSAAIPDTGLRVATTGRLLRHQHLRCQYPRAQALPSSGPYPPQYSLPLVLKQVPRKSKDTARIRSCRFEFTVGCDMRGFVLAPYELMAGW